MSIDVFPATVLNSTLWNGQTYAEGTFTVTGTGFSGTAPSGVVPYVRVGKQVTVEVPFLTGTSNATTFGLTGWPAALCPMVTSNIGMPVRVSDNGGAYVWGTLIFTTPAGTVMLQTTPVPGSAWTASGIKSVTRNALAYVLP